MVKKLTLSIDDTVIEEAKRLARENQTSVSSMFERFVRLAGSRDKSEPELGPITRQATGLLSLPKDKTYRELLDEAVSEKFGAGR